MTLSTVSNTRKVHHFNDVDQAVVSLEIEGGRFMALIEDRQFCGFGGTRLEAIADLSQKMRKGE